ncbi:MAG: cytochrome b [Gammaproteobacteria bacterium]|nr:cytochrome b [Gammaproteobacteria bacterium]
MPKLTNTKQEWGWLAIVMHWLSAVAVIGLFLLGIWMVELTYYDDWYHQAPAIHKAVGMLLFGLVFLRLGWRLLNPPPATVPGTPRVIALAAEAAHWLIYLLLFAILASGYLMTTAKGDPVSIFGWFEVPAPGALVERQEEIMGLLHYWTAWALVGLVAIHAMGAIKHHVVDRDETLRRMLGLGNASQPDYTTDRKTKDNKEIYS